jgi:energy-coupling factor transporter ATP-binding protein EcfA2
VAEASRILKLDDYLARKPKALSGGQRQRVAIGRAIVRGPEVFLFDEPLSNLDAELRVEMRVEIARLHKEIGATMIYVTHDQVEAMTLADKIVVLRAGRIEQVGKPLDLYIGSPAMTSSTRQRASWRASSAQARPGRQPRSDLSERLGGVSYHSGRSSPAQASTRSESVRRMSESSAILRVDLDQVFLRQGFHVRRGATAILPEREKRAAILDREAERPGPGEKAQLVDMGRAEPAVAVGVAVGRDQPDLLVIADGLGRQARPFGHVTDIHAALTRFSRRAFATTRTELAAIAPAANIGFNSGPPNSARPPAATGISATL